MAPEVAGSYTVSAPTKEAITASALCGELVSRYPRPEWHVETEVTLAGRRLDVVAFNLWGARSYRTVGFEIKVSRGDWMRELADFRKQDEWLAVVDEFFIVAPGGLVKPEELPQGWGLLELRGSRMFVKAHPAVRRGVTLPREVVARFFTRILAALGDERQRSESIDRSISIAARNDLREEIRREMEGRENPELAEWRRRAQRYDEIMRDVGLGSWWDDEKLRTAVRLLKHDGVVMGLTTLARDLKQSASKNAEVADRIIAFADALQATPVAGTST